MPNPECLRVSGCGKWERPLKSNPEYKGPWVHPLIDNPSYVGEWAPRQIDNPSYFQDLQPSSMAPIGGVALEIWTMQAGTLLDNVFVGSDVEEAAAFRAATTGRKQAQALLLSAHAKRVTELTNRHKALKSGTLGGKLEFYLGALMDFVGENLLLAGGAGVGGLVAFFYFCVKGDQGAPQQQEEEYAEDGSEEEEEEEEEEEDTASAPAAAPAAASGLRQRKGRTPKSS